MEKAEREEEDAKSWEGGSPKQDECRGQKKLDLDDPYEFFST